jgi:predicted helicase
MKYYITSHPEKVSIECYYKILNPELYTCYEIDNMIKKEFNNYRLKLGGGIEFYEHEKLTQKLLEIYFNNKKIKWKKYYDIEITNYINTKDIKNIIFDFEQYNKIEINNVQFNIETNLLIDFIENIKSEKIIKHLITLNNDIFNILYNNINNNDILFLKNNLIDHQIQVILQTIIYFQYYDMGILNLFCRYGKTRTSCLFCKIQKYKKILILVPSLYLINQTFETWNKFYDKNIIKKICCYDNIKNNEIENFYNDNEMCIFISTYHSSYKLNNLHFDIGIFDEAHKTTGKKEFNQTVSDTISDHVSNPVSDSVSDPVFDSVFESCTVPLNISFKVETETETETITETKTGTETETETETGNKTEYSLYKRELENKKIKKKIFLTATTKEYTGLEDYFSMDDEAVYGKIIVSVSAKKAKELDRICNYNIITVELKPYRIEFNIDDFFNKNKIQDKKERENLKKLQDKYIASAIGLCETMKTRSIKHVITFHDFINNCKFFSYILKKISNFDINNINCISGLMNMETRKTIIDHFQNQDYSILCSAKVLQEGVDIPKCDGIIFIDHKTSIIDTVQSLSRCLTKTDNYKEGNIMILYDEKTDLINDEYTNNTRLVLRNLVENDDNLKELLT